MPEEDGDFQKRLERIETLIQQIQSSGDPATQASAQELVEVLLELHATGLEQLLDIVWETGEAGERIIHEELPEDDLVSSLLILHGLHPLGLEARVQQALEKVRPYMDSHGGGVELLEIQNGVVRLRLEGSCESCRASTLTLKYAVEDAIYEAAPEVTDVEAVGLPGEEESTDDSFIPLDQASANGASPSGTQQNGARQPASNGRPGEKGEWHEVSGLAALEEGAVRAKQVAGQSVLFFSIDGSRYAYGSACPNCHQSLDAAQLEGTTLACPHCACAFDVVRAGRATDASADVQLEPIPLLEEEGRVNVALPAAAA